MKSSRTRKMRIPATRKLVARKQNPVRSHALLTRAKGMQIGAVGRNRTDMTESRGKVGAPGRT
jgi:hypothetical protein